MTTTFASEKQINWIADLLAKKAWNDDNAVARKFISRAALVNVAISWANDPSTMGTAVTDVATSSILGERVNQILVHAGVGAVAENEYLYAPLTGKAASNMITWLQNLPVKSDAAKAAGSVTAKSVRITAGSVELEDGMYMVDGKIYKVQHTLNGSRQYAKVAIIAPSAGDSYDVSFDYAPGAIARIRPEHKLSYEQAKEFGALYGTCCCCGRTLSNELSIALGIGPVCGEREFGGDFKITVKAAKLQLKAS